jgi:hypothetical protein
MNYYDRIKYDPDTGGFVWAVSAPGIRRGAGGNGKGTGQGGDAGGGGAGGRVYLIEFGGTLSSASWATRMQTGTSTAVAGNLNSSATGGAATAGIIAKFDL